MQTEEFIMEEKKNWFKELDPDVVFQQPLRPGCWIEGCKETRTTGMLLSFPLTMFAQGLCDRHADKLQERLNQKGYTEECREGLITGLANTPLINSFMQQVMDGTASNSDLLLPSPFPKDWYKYAISVSLVHAWPTVQCWFRTSEKEKCPEEPRVTSVLRIIPGCRQQTTAPFIGLSDNRSEKVFMIGICRGHANSVYNRAVVENNFFRYPQPAGGVVFLNPKCMFPFGRDPDDDPSNEKDVAAA